MLHRPLSIVGTTLFLGVLIPCLAIVWLANYGTSFFENVDPFVAAMGFLSTVIGYGVWKVKPWGFYSYIALSCFILGALLYQLILAPNLEDSLVFFGVATFIIGSCTLVQKHMSAPYFNPNFQWGRRDPRYHVNLDVKFEVNQKSCAGGVLDISRTGCFVDLETQLAVGEVIDLHMTMLNFDLKLQARVVRGSIEPKGFGLMFLGVTKEQRAQIDHVIGSLLKAA